MNEVLILATVVAPITLALVLGLLIGFASTPFTNLDIVYRLWAGGLSGLATVGLFELGNRREGYSKDEKR